MNDFSVIIISYNGMGFLRQSLDKISVSNLKPKQVIVIDDFSNDGTENTVRQSYKWVEFYRNEKNLGSTASRNIGAKHAAGKYLIFLDNDVLVHQDSFKKILGFLESVPNVGVAGAKLLWGGKYKMKWNMGYDPNFIREGVGDIFGFFLKLFPNSKWLYDLTMKFNLNYWRFVTIREVGWVVECFFALRRDLFEKIGGMDEKFFMFGEGPDLCRRIRKAGFGIYFYPEAQADLLQGHMHSKSKRRILFAKFLIIYYLKHYFHFIN